MAENPGEDPSVDLTPNPIIQKLKSLADQGEPPAPVVALVGYLGESADADLAVPLYLRLDLSCYYRILKTDIVFTVASESSDASRPTKIFVKASARVEVVHTSEASFLAGSIACGNGVWPTDSATAITWLPKTYEIVETGPHCKTIDCRKAGPGGAAFGGGVPPEEFPTGPHCETVDFC